MKTLEQLNAELSAMLKKLEQLKKQAEQATLDAWYAIQLEEDRTGYNEIYLNKMDEALDRGDFDTLKALNEKREQFYKLSELLNIPIRHVKP